MQQHRSRAHSGDTFTCNKVLGGQECGKKFSLKDTLKKHMKVCGRPAVQVHWENLSPTAKARRVRREANVLVTLLREKTGEERRLFLRVLAKEHSNVVDTKTNPFTLEDVIDVSVYLILLLDLSSLTFYSHRSS